MRGHNLCESSGERGGGGGREGSRQSRVMGPCRRGGGQQGGGEGVVQSGVLACACGHGAAMNGVTMITVEWKGGVWCVVDAGNEGNKE